MHRALKTAIAVAAGLLAAPFVAHATPDLPQGVATRDTSDGLALVDAAGQPLYWLDLDRAEKRRRSPPGAASLCASRCHRLWRPVIAPVDFRTLGDWSAVERNGVRQLAYRGDPLYTFTGASLTEAAALGVYPPYLSSYSAKPALIVDGVPVSGVYWHPAAYQPPEPKVTAPAGVSVKWAKSAYVFADVDGHGLYASQAAQPCPNGCGGFEPLVAPLAAYPVGRWRLVEGADGVRDWSYGGQVVYRRAAEGPPAPGWTPLKAQ